MRSLYEYFAAGSDDAAVDATYLPGGPLAVARRAGATASWDVIDGSVVSPTANLADLEELLTGVAYDDIVEDQRSGKTLASLEDACVVVTLTDRLHDALAALPVGRIAVVAGDWSHTEEFGGAASPGDLTQFLTDLADLARRAKERAQKLYCWVSL